MAFILDSEEEFDNDEQLAETPETGVDARYEDLRTRFFTRRPMKYEELEELAAEAEKRGDQDVVRALRTILTEDAGPGEADPEDGGEETLPDGLVFETLETLRRMY